MKTYVFRDICWSFCFVITCLCFFIYGVIWLNNGYKIEDVKIELEGLRYEHTKLKNSIMPSAIKGRPSYDSKSSR
jgi:hypothetical protein